MCKFPPNLLRKLGTTFCQIYNQIKIWKLQFVGITLTTKCRNVPEFPVITKIVLTSDMFCHLDLYIVTFLWPTENLLGLGCTCQETYPDNRLSVSECDENEKFWYLINVHVKFRRLVCTFILILSTKKTTVPPFKEIILFSSNL